MKKKDQTKTKVAGNRKKTSPQCKYDPKYLIPIYEMSSDGMSLSDISQALGFSAGTVKTWSQKIPEVSEACRRGREKVKSSGVDDFFEYTYGRLPPELMDVWEEIVELDADPSRERVVENMLRKKGTRSRQHLFVHALVRSNFNASEACRKAMVSSQELQNWKRDGQFTALMTHVLEEAKCDFGEGALLKLVSEGNPAAVIFFNRTKNRDRGYDPKHTIDFNASLNLTAEISLDEALEELPLDDQMRILQAVRSKRSRGALPPRDVTPEGDADEE